MFKSKSKFKGSLVLSLVLAATVALTACGSGQTNSKGAAIENYPNKPIEYIVPYAAGGGVDLVARAVADALSKEWGQPITVVNKPGGGGVTGAQYALQQAPADGYTVLANVVSNTSMLAAGFNEPALKLDDQLFVSRIVQDAPAFTVKADAEWETFNEFTEWAKQNPEQLTWTTSGVSGYSSFVAAEYMKEIGVDFNKTGMVVTKGTAESLPMIAGGDVVLGLHPISEVSTMVKAGKLKILAVQSEERSPYFPDVPTASEQGINNLTATWWTGLSVRKGTPDDIVKKWNEALEKITKDAEFIDKLKNMQMEPSFLNTEDYNEFVNTEADYYTDLATKLGIRK